MSSLKHLLVILLICFQFVFLSIKSMAFQDVELCDIAWWQTADLPQVTEVVTQWQARVERGDLVADRSLCPSGDYTPFELAARWNPYPEVMDFLLESGFFSQMHEEADEDLVYLKFFEVSATGEVQVIEEPVKTFLYLAMFNVNPEILNTIQRHISAERNQETQGQEDSKLYFGIAGGVHSHTGMSYEGWNQDTTCYPNQACFRDGLDSPVSGYRWAYNVSAEKPGIALQGFIGYRTDERIRVEVSAGLQTTPLQQEFKHIQQRVGSQYIPVETDPHTTVISSSQADIGDMTVGDVSFNAYVDVLNPNRRVVPFGGVGVGFSGIKINDLDFSQQFEDPQNPKGYIPPLPLYDSMTDGSLFDVLLTVYLHLGFDVNVTDRTSIGFKSTLSKMMGDIAFRDPYLSHPMNYSPPLQKGLMPQSEEMGFHYDTSLMGIQNWRTMVEVKWKR